MSYLMKPNLILLPGLLNDARLWQAQAEGLAEVANVSVADLTGSDTIAGLAASVLEQAPKPLDRATICQMMMIAVADDDWPVLVEGRWRWMVAHVVQNAGYWVARLWYGMSAWYEEYTPSRLHAVASR